MRFSSLVYGVNTVNKLLCDALIFIIIVSGVIKKNYSNLFERKFIMLLSLTKKKVLVQNKMKENQLYGDI